ncbi:hypothetical protein PINS_up013703 [Pythium insidiosum]|nr:hypothetical protein PINS_up013703 [Pythium insidiosum]
MERRGLSLVRRRSLSQQAWRHQEERVASTAKTPVRSAVDGRSYLLPTVTLQRSPGSNAIAPTAPTDAPLLLQTRTRLSPVVLDLQRVSSDGTLRALWSVVVCYSLTYVQALHTRSPSRSTSYAPRWSGSM